jgi:hypothetical protein
MGYIWVRLQLSVTKSLMFPRDAGQTRPTAPCLWLGTRKDMTKVLQFEQPSSTVHISGSGGISQIGPFHILAAGGFVHD